MLEIKTIGRLFSVDLKVLEGYVSQEYDIKSVRPLEFLAKGYVNLNFMLETAHQKFVIRLFGEYDDNTIIELEVMEELAGKGFPTARPIRAKSGKLIRKYEDYHLSVFEFIEGKIPDYSSETFERIGNTVADFQDMVTSLETPIKNENRYLSVYRRRHELIELVEKEDKLLKKILDPGFYSLIPEQIRLFSEINLPDEDDFPAHSDIYNLNMLDDGQTMYLLDFEYIGLGHKIIDTVSYIAFDGIVNDRTDKDYRGNGKPRLLLDQIKAYVSGYKNKSKIEYVESVIDAFMLVNIGDNFYNMEKVIKAKENLFGGFIRHWNNAQIVLKNRRELEKIF